MTRLVIGLVMTALLTTLAAASLCDGRQLTDSQAGLSRTVEDRSPAAPWGCHTHGTAGIATHGPTITAC